MEEGNTVQREINGCKVLLKFSDSPPEDTIRNIRCILSDAYNERVQKELAEENTVAERRLAGPERTVFP